MRNIGHCGCSLLGRLLIFATRKTTTSTQPVHKFSKDGSPPCAAMLTDKARSAA
jgi:hypothetical protein